jgi:hypothetical protein
LHTHNSLLNKFFACFLNGWEKVGFRRLKAQTPGLIQQEPDTFLMLGLFDDRLQISEPVLVWYDHVHSWRFALTRFNRAEDANLDQITEHALCSCPRYLRISRQQTT